MRISVCMITRDEERNLQRCLDSLAGKVDEVCVLDTGSVDATVRIAQESGAKVARTAWREDFGAARNASLELATGDWILVLDADETLPSHDARQPLEAFARLHPRRAGQLTVRDQSAGDGPNHEVHTVATRFFPRIPEASFVGAVHEQLHFAGATPPRAHTGVDILHYGYTRDAFAQKNKGRRNIHLLHAELAKQPECAYLWYQLGLTHLMIQDYELALRTLTGALAHVDPNAPFVAHLTENLCTSLRELGHFDEALALISEIEDRFAQRADTVFLRGLLAMDTGRLEDAEHCFYRCLALAGTRPQGGPYSPTASTTAPAHNLGALHEVSGRIDQARHYYRMALSFDRRHQPTREALRRLRAAEQPSRLPALRV